MTNIPLKSKRVWHRGCFINILVRLNVSLTKHKTRPKMIRQERIKAMYRIILLTASVCCFFGLVAKTSAMPPVKNEPSESKKGSTTKPGSPSFAFSGATEVVLIPAGAPGAPGQPKVLKSFNVKDLIDLMWNGQRKAAETDLKKYLGVSKNTSGHRLHDIHVKLAQAGQYSKMRLSVQEKTGTFTLTYIVPKNEMDFEVAVDWLPDPTYRISFDVVVTAHLSCKGTDEHAPLKVLKADIHLENVKVRGNVIARIESFVATLFTGSSPQVDIRRAFARIHTDVTKQLTTHVDQIDKLISNQAQGATMAPRFDHPRNKLILTLTQRLANQQVLQNGLAGQQIQKSTK